MPGRLVPACAPPPWCFQPSSVDEGALPEAVNAALVDVVEPKVSAPVAGAPLTTARPSSMLGGARLSNLRSSRSTGSRSSAVAAVCWDAGKEHGGPQAPIQQQQQSRQEQQQHQQSVPQRAYMLGQLPQPSQAKLQLGKPVTMQLWQYQQLQMQQSSQQGSPARGSELSTKDSSGSASADGGGASICSVAGSGPSIRPERGSLSSRRLAATHL